MIAYESPEQVWVPVHFQFQASDMLRWLSLQRRSVNWKFCHFVSFLWYLSSSSVGFSVSWNMWRVEHVQGISGFLVYLEKSRDAAVLNTQRVAIYPSSYTSETKERLTATWRFDRKLHGLLWDLHGGTNLTNNSTISQKSRYYWMCLHIAICRGGAGYIQLQKTDHF